MIAQPRLLQPDEGAGRIIALYLDLVRDVDFFVGTVGSEDVYTAVDRATADDVGLADAWMQRANGTVQECTQDWELTPLTEEGGSMAPLAAARVFHDAPDLFAAVWQARLERLAELD